MPDSPILLSGIERASVLLLALGESVAADVVGFFTPHEAEQTGNAMTRLGNLSSDRVHEVTTCFLRESRQASSPGINPAAYIRKLFTKVLGEDKAAVFLNQLLPEPRGKGLELLQWMDARAVAELLGPEHPQILAVVLSSLDSGQSAKVLAALPADKQADVLMRIARLERVPGAAFEALDVVLVQQCARPAALKSSRIGGVDLAVELLARIEQPLGGTIIDQIQQADEGLGRQLQVLGSGFAFLLEMHDREIQILLRSVSLEVLSVALVGAEKEVKEKIINNMSSQHIESLDEMQGNRAAVLPQDVDRAQQEILLLAHRM